MIGSCLMIGLKGLSLLKEERDFIISNNIAGVILFKRNIQSFQQVYELCYELKSLSKTPLLIAIDMEGGEVNRFSHLKESPSWPAPSVLSTLPKNQIFSIARSMARQLSLLGIDINFAPVVDLLIKNNPLLTERVFGKSKEEILNSVHPFLDGLVKENIIPCLKHFPGHGGVEEDSHKILPRDSRQLKELKPQLDIFQSLFEKYFCWIMTAHIEFSNIEKKPATFSKTLLSRLLKNQMAFKGILVSDDIDMEALSHFSPGECFLYALQGGCDLVIAGQQKDSPKEIIKYFQQNKHKKEEIKSTIYNSSQKVLKIRNQLSLPPPSFQYVNEELSKIRIPELSSI